MRSQFRAVFEYEGKEYKPLVPTDAPRWAVMGVQSSYRWNWLGKEGSSEYGGFAFGPSLFKNEAQANQRADEIRAATHDSERSGGATTLSNEVGNNDHLIGVKVWERVEVIPCRIIPRGE